MSETTEERDERIQAAYRARRANGESSSKAEKSVARRFGLPRKQIVRIVNTIRRLAEKEEATA